MIIVKDLLQVMSAVFLGTLMIGSTGLVLPPPPLSPCPSIFKYETLKVENVWVGKVSIPPPPSGIPLDLFIHLQIQTVLPTKYVGFVELIDTQEIVARRIAQSNKQPILYRVRFPLLKPLPTIKMISVNNQIICANKQLSGSIVTDIHLKHSLIPISANKSSTDQNAQFIREEEEIGFYQHELVQDNQCGLSISPNLLMVGGRIARQGDWPWLTAIFISNSLGLQFHCSGSIISTKFVVTAGHCTKDEEIGNLKPSSVFVYIGKYNLRKWTETFSSLKEVAAIHLHPDFDLMTFSADVALLQLTDAIVYNSFIKPVCLWSGKSNLNHIIGLKGTVVGWGQDETDNKMTSEPRVIQLPIVSTDDCINSNGKFYYLTSSRTFCAGLKDGHGPCNGDSGGGLYLPVMKNGETKWKLRGIVSLSLLNKTTNYCDLTQYIVFTDVAQFRHWLFQIVQNNS